MNHQYWYPHHDECSCLKLLTWYDHFNFSGTPASSTTKTGRHDIAEILLKVALKHQKNQINQSINKF